MKRRPLFVLISWLVCCTTLVVAGERNGEAIRDEVRRYRVQNEVRILRELADFVALPNDARKLADMEANAEHFSDFFEDLFGRAGGGFQQGRQHGFQMKGEDHHAKIGVSIEDAYHGAERTITLKMPEVDASGHVITRDRNLNIKIPKGVTQGQRIRLRGQGGPANGHLRLFARRAPTGPDPNAGTAIPDTGSARTTIDLPSWSSASNAI